MFQIFEKLGEASRELPEIHLTLLSFLMLLSTTPVAQKFLGHPVKLAFVLFILDEIQSKIVNVSKCCCAIFYSNQNCSCKGFHNKDKVVCVWVFRWFSAFVKSLHLLVSFMLKNEAKRILKILISNWCSSDAMLWVRKVTWKSRHHVATMQQHSWSIHLIYYWLWQVLLCQNRKDWVECERHFFSEKEQPLYLVYEEQRSKVCNWSFIEQRDSQKHKALQIEYSI